MIKSKLLMMMIYGSARGPGSSMTVHFSATIVENKLVDLID
jgi:hypothetical protein